MKFNVINKKGAIEITATAIVVLIIAIIVLGSVIFFIKTFFGQTTSLIGEQLDQVKADLLTFMKSSGEPLGFSFREELKLKKSETKEVVFAVQNNVNNPDPVKSTVCYRIGIKCLSPFEGNSCLTSFTQTDVLVGGTDGSAGVSGGTGFSSNLWFKDSTLLKSWDVDNNKESAEPIKVQITNAPIGKFRMQATLYKAKGNVDCKTAGTTTVFEESFTKRFRIVIE